jgi:DNA-directed RNA polymerase specialized sigma24 family protein
VVVAVRVSSVIADVTGSRAEHAGLRIQRETMEAIDRVYRFALHLTGNPADAEDLVQETYLRAYQHRNQYQPGTNCTAWLFTICRHLWMQQQRRGETAAQILGIPVGTVRSQLFRGRRLLQARLLAYAEDAGILPSRGGDR